MRFSKAISFLYASIFSVCISAQEFKFPTYDLSFGALSSTYFYKKPGDGKEIQTKSFGNKTLFNHSPGYFVYLGIRITEETAFNIGFELGSKEILIVTPDAGPGQYYGTKYSIGFGNIPIGFTHQLLSKPNYNLQLLSRLSYLRINQQRINLYNDTLPVSNYSTRNRQSYSFDHSITASETLSFGYKLLRWGENDIYFQELYLIAQASAVFSPHNAIPSGLGRKIRLDFRLGLSYKIY